jgi:F0F1-type ATP synthase gamma subunit
MRHAKGNVSVEANEREADLISKLSDEKVKIARKIGKMRKDIDTSEVIHIFDWLKCSYTDQISDKVSLMTTKFKPGLSWKTNYNCIFL